jgi:hypothetical protein
MLGWFAPKCPLDTWEKAWTETRLNWLAGRFGIQRLLEAEVVLPTEEYFPDPYDGTPDDARRLLDRLSFYMGIDPLTIDLTVSGETRESRPAGPNGGTGQAVLRVPAAQLADPERLLAALAHGLARELLRGDGPSSADVADREGIIDLLPVFLGVGVFGANATLYEQYGSDGHWTWWTIGKHGYLPARVFGYAFALFALMRGEENPSWAKHLRPDAAAALHEGLRYLHKSGDSLFHPDTVGQSRRPLPAGELGARLETGTASVRLAALWEVRDRHVSDPAVRASVIRCLEDPDRAIPGEAARTLAGFGPEAAEAVPRLRKMLWDAVTETRAGAAFALGELGAEPAEVIPELSALLEDRNGQVMYAAAGALHRFGVQAEAATGGLLAALKTALIECDQPLVEALAGALLAVAPDLKQQVREYFDNRDPELRRLALAALKEQRSLSRR